MTYIDVDKETTLSSAHTTRYGWMSLRPDGTRVAAGMRSATSTASLSHAAFLRVGLSRSLPLRRSSSYSLSAGAAPTKASLLALVTEMRNLANKEECNTKVNQLGRLAFEILRRL